MNKTLLMGIAAAALVGGLIWWYASQTTQIPPAETESLTQEEASQELQQNESPEQAADAAVEKIEAEFSGAAEMDFSVDGLSDQALDL